MMNQICHDCKVRPGELHVPGCDAEQCARCGMQAIGCNCVYEVNGIKVSTMEQTHPDIYEKGPTAQMNAVFFEQFPDRLPWTGESWGVAECREFGWFTIGKFPDLNRLILSARWDKDSQRFVKRI